MLRLPTLPLLTKELAEQSARRRTYIVRALYALLLYGFALGFFYQRVGNWSSGEFSMLGRGQELFQAVLLFQFVAVYALLPMLMAGVLTSEKERDTLALLLITRLGPWTIVLEKFLSRTIPMLYYLLLSLPLLGVAYSLGGVDTGAVLRAGIALTVCVLQVGALALLCSAWCRTTSQALVMTYVVGGVLFAVSRVALGAPIAELVPSPTYRPVPTRSMQIVRLVRAGQRRPARVSTPVVQYQTEITPVNPFVTIGSPWLYATERHAVGKMIPPAGVILGQVFLCLLLARLVLWRRAFLRPRNWGLKLLKAIDALMHRLNQNSITKGRILIHEDTTLPWDQPIAWRETTRRSFGTTRYLVRLLLAIEVPVLFWLLVPSFDDWHAAARAPGQIEQWIVWWLGTLIIITQSTGLITGERSRQTLDVLLSTPLSAQEIVRQKLAGVWRVMVVLAIPFVTCIAMSLWWEETVQVLRRQPVGQHVLLSALALTVYWPLIALVGMECGLRCRTQLQAMTVTLGIVVGVFAAPFALFWALPPQLSSLWSDWCWWLEPLSPFATALSTSYPLSSHWLALRPERTLVIGAHVVCYIGLGVLLWRQIPREFSRVVRRCEPPEPGTLSLGLPERERRGAAHEVSGV